MSGCFDTNQEGVKEEDKVTDTEKVALSLHAILEQSLSIALERICPKYPDLAVEVVMPIALSRFICRELFIISLERQLSIDKLRDVFVALLDDLIEKNPEVL